ncbi:prefoldin subunit 5-like [Acanthaster planci]|uniref:Prefoldin subunit 5-like n=1 Tax=Acanthaster planci TaxID=133434 RepID=A0A8B7XNV8_ACAPL|nr:prefoldin subunit 5-like [Acanthaster planci]
MAGGSGGPQAIDLMQLALPQLNMLKEEIEQEVEMLQGSLQQLKMAQGRFVESTESLSKFDPKSEGKEILVPLTASLYIPGKLKDVNNVLIDIGTGYYVEKTLPQAQEYFKRKVDFVTKQMERVQPVLIEKSKMRQVVTEVMNMKIQAQMSMTQGQGVKS